MRQLTKSVLFVAPHPDDETLGCGGVISRFRSEGCDVHWLIVTDMASSEAFTPRQVEQRRREIDAVSEFYGFATTTKLAFPPAGLDEVSMRELVPAIADCIDKVLPTDIFMPYRNDVHSDHASVFDAVIAASKAFRRPFISRLYAYEVLSETDYGLNPEDGGFRPNVFFDVTDVLDQKLAALEIYAGEVQKFPFPRSRVALTALAQLRGAQCNSMAAEAFMLLKEIK